MTAPHRPYTPDDEERAVAAWMQELAAVPLETAGDAGSSPASDPVYMWWKAEMLRRWDAQRRVVAPIEVGERIVAGIALFAALTLFRWLWHQLSVTASGVSADLLQIAWAVMIGIFVLLAGTAFFAFRNLFHSEVSS
jgi:hypothetical protein